MLCFQYSKTNLTNYGKFNRIMANLHLAAEAGGGVLRMSAGDARHTLLSPLRLTVNKSMIFCISTSESQWIVPIQTKGLFSKRNLRKHSCHCWPAVYVTCVRPITFILNNNNLSRAKAGFWRIRLRQRGHATCRYSWQVLEGGGFVTPTWWSCRFPCLLLCIVFQVFFSFILLDHSPINTTTDF